MRRTSFADDTCPVAKAVDVVGDWWSFLIVRDAFLGRRRFGEFQTSLGVAKNILTDRLKKLVDADPRQRSVGLPDVHPGGVQDRHPEGRPGDSHRGAPPVLLARPAAPDHPPERHQATLVGNEIEIVGGKVCRFSDGKEYYEDNQDRFTLNLRTGTWSRVTQPLT